MEEEFGTEDEIESAPDLSATSDATTLSTTSNCDQSPVSSNPSCELIEQIEQQWNRRQTIELNGRL